ncbi:TPA: ParB/RepB/Spo0J family partition protein [Streptococcus suis]|uniref:ParB/RepB/Spo0J family partition protein n=1 Tax=Streptococcus parasuis TaxID=1501662 RepID=UPI00155481D2|nr:ParB/RepB/Spo0J family partition protein [Streptococcus parasuis]MBY4972068.1 ParB/RepB/Spo0J family partition protein [Streptococcus suis]MDG4478711.1 ParB/RepB/Spo0J family partition protein [Streptococcus parasuis]NQN51751.1 ParB/RepB/Spo0J family partition protein [Streptococcus suis]NQP58959.1 ParB/RepB/Spo0J family partition protein [Streptococcus suis]HEL1557530.1 ParB/RepB/Spo0J family partition protein [Streptococcus suis]
MEELHYLKIKDIQANPYQPRLHFDEEKLLELAQSIKENGVIQPIIVRRSPLIGFELLAGERRLRASQLAGLTEIPAVIKHLSDDDLLYQAIIENLQRSDLNPIEEAHSYEKLIEKGLTHDEIAQIMGKSRPYITNLLRLLHLSESTRQAVETGKITQGHARQLVSLSEKQQAEWVQKIQEKDISVRQLETILSSKKKKTIRKSNQFVAEEEEKLAKLLGTKVTIQQKKNGSGQLTIQFQNIEEFERIINSLK